jgi:hypothetical protein
MRSTRLVDKKAAARDEQTPRHIWESEQQQTSSAKLVDRPYGRPREGEVGESKAPG